MARLTKNSLADSLIRDCAISLIRMMGVQDYPDFAQSARQWVRQRTILIGEPDEMLIPPEQIIDRINQQGCFYGDCDDASMLLAALCRAVGLPARFRAVFPAMDGSFSHVFVETDISVCHGEWLALDPTITGYPAWNGNSIVQEI